MFSSDDISYICSLAEKAGQRILQYYRNDDLKVHVKADASPFTRADIEANQIIEEGLLARFPDIPLVSEESKLLPVAERQAWQRYWLIDPLDGTKEFLNRTDNFTVNIALIENAKPSFGVIQAPVYSELYYGQIGQGAFKKTIGDFAPIKARKFSADDIKVLLSRIRKSKEFEYLSGLYPTWNAVGMGSSLKFCRLAEGFADIYVRLLPTSEWDTAAGQCILAAAGGKTIDLKGQDLRYNKDHIDNPSFVALADKDWPADTLLEQLREALARA